MADSSRKMCSVCGKSFSLSEFSYGKRENRSYCQSCDKGVSAAYSKGGKAAAQAFREKLRAKWEK